VSNDYPEMCFNMGMSQIETTQSDSAILASLTRPELHHVHVASFKEWKILKKILPMWPLTNMKFAMIGGQRLNPELNI
jgi:hypothetical protein